MLTKSALVRTLIVFLSFLNLSLVSFAPGSVTELVGGGSSFISIIIIVLLFLLVFVDERYKNISYRSSLNNFVLFLTALTIIGVLITSLQLLLNLGALSNYFDLARFTNLLAPFVFMVLMKDSDISYLGSLITKVLEVYLILSLFFILLQLIYPLNSIWIFFSEGSHYHHLISRVFGINGSPTQSAFVILFISLFFFVKRQKFFFLLSGIEILLIQNKLTVMVYILAVIYLIAASNLSKLTKIISLFLFLLAATSAILVLPDISSFIFSEERLANSNTYNHRLDIMLAIKSNLSNSQFILLGFPDKTFWAETFRSFDMMYALIIFRFGVLFLLLFLMSMFSVSFLIKDKSSRALTILFLFGTSFTMIGFAHTRYGILCAWVIAYSYWYSKNIKKSGKV